MRIWPIHTMSCGGHLIDKSVFCPSQTRIVPIHRKEGLGGPEREILTHSTERYKALFTEFSTKLVVREQRRSKRFAPSVSVR